MSRELLELILLKLIKKNAWYDGERSTVISAIKEELAKPLPEPICSKCKAIGAAYSIGKESPMRDPLSDDEMLLIYKKQFHANVNVNVNVKISQKRSDCYDFARAIEKAHGIGQ